MADQHRQYEDNRRGGRRDWNDRYTDDGYTFAPGQPSGHGRGPSEFGGRGYEREYGGEEPGRWQSGPEGRSFGGQRTYARDLYSDSGMRRHDTDWESGMAGRSMRNVPSGGGFRGRGPKDYQRSDERIREEVCDRMTDDDRLDATDITIQVKQGEVTLSGTVTDRDQKRRAEDMAEGISGVRDVTNNIRIAREQNGLDLTQKH